MHLQIPEYIFHALPRELTARAFAYGKPPTYADYQVPSFSNRGKVLAITKNFKIKEIVIKELEYKKQKTVEKLPC